MLDNQISLNNILVSFEGTLKIEHLEEARVEDCIRDAIARLEETYGTKLDKSVYALMDENQLTADNLNLFLRDIKACLEQMSLFIQLKLYHKNFAVTLADVNYLGYAKKSLLTALKYLQDATEYTRHRDDVITPLYNTLNNINMCSIKRMFVVMLMFDRLGIDEGVAIMAELLYLGGLVV